MNRYVQIGVRPATAQGDPRIVTVKDDLGSRKRIVTDPMEQIVALIEARFEYALTSDEKAIVAQQEADKLSMEANHLWAAF